MDWVEYLYNRKSKLFKAVKHTFKDNYVKKWLVIGITAYGTPAAYRFITKNPIFLPEIEISEFLPSNLIEKLLVNPVAPGGVGAVVGEKFWSEIKNKRIRGLEKYLSRLAGSVTATSIWTLIQYFGYQVSELLKYEWPSGGNPFEPPSVYPFNFFIALTLAPLLPYAADYVKKLKKFMSSLSIKKFLYKFNFLSI